MNRRSLVLYLTIAAVVLAALYINLLSVPPELRQEEPVACTMEAKMCPDGSAVGRSGPECQFTACPGAVVASDVQEQIDSKADLITISTPEPGNRIVSPLQLSGEARGYWFFEASAPVVLTNWDGEIIAESYVTTDGEWMTEEKVPFSGTLEFESPYQQGDPEFMERGTLIFRKDNPSGMPEHDDAVEIPVVFKRMPASDEDE